MRYIFLLLALLCVSCGTALPTVKPYKLDVQQGNVVTSKMLLQLRPGMTKSQVRFIMGTPLIQDSFHGNRWDYVYQMREAGKIKEQRRVILDFESDLLKTVRGDVVAAGSESSKASEPEAPIGTRVVTPIKKSAEKSLVEKLKFWQKDDVELAKQAADKEAASKIKLEAEQAAKNTPDNKLLVPQVNENVAPVADESKSLLVVPVLVEPINTPPAQSSVAEPQAVVPAVDVVKPAAAPIVPASSLPESTTPDSLTPANKQLAQPASQLAEPVTELAPAAIEPLQAPEKAPSYQSDSGMQFDKHLQIEVEQDDPAPKPAGPRSGNKVAPQPKPFPQENDPSFFDRMLEKIGF